MLIIGYNNEGKTSILEAIASIDFRNLETIKKFRNTQNVSANVEGFIDGKYFKGFGSRQFIASLIYPSELPHMVTGFQLSFEASKTLSELLGTFDESIFYVYSVGNDIRVVYKDKSNYSIFELGQGYKSLISFLINYADVSPEIILVDNLEAFVLHPELLKKFYDYLFEISERVKLIMITTQSHDVIHFLAEKAKEKGKISDVLFLFICGNNYGYLRADEILKREPYEDVRYTACKVALGGTKKYGEGK